MKLNRLWTIVFATLLLCVSAHGAASAPATQTADTQPSAQTAPASQPAPQASTEPASQPAQALDAGQVKEQAFHALLAGHYQQGVDLLSQIPDDPQAAKALAWARQYVGAEQQAQAERTAELQAAQRRVRLARLTEEFRPKIVEAKIDEKLFACVEGMADAFVASDKLLSTSATSQPAQTSKKATDDIDKAIAKVDEIQKLPKVDEMGDWSAAFNEINASLRQALTEYRQCWQEAALPRDWTKLTLSSEKVQDAMIDLGVLVSKDPLIVALSHARQAKEIAGPSDDFNQQPWVKELIAQAEKRGQEMLAQGKWMDALTIYGHAGLSDLDHDNADYQQIVKKVNQHVRVISLYGDQAALAKAATQPAGSTTQASQPSTQPASPSAALSGEEDADEGSADGSRWREMIVGVDTKIVRSAISQIDFNYVDNPNYRKMAQAALQAIQVLAQTPEAYASFASLKDETHRAAFIEGISRQIDQIAKMETLDQLDLALMLKRLLDLNNETVRLPAEVIDMEFAEAMCGELDPFSTMVWPYEEAEFQKRTMGNFPGIGVQISKDPGKPVEVVTPLPDTPAFRAGILAGDAILTVEGIPTQPLTVDKVVKMITGPRHTKVTLSIQRQGMPTPFDLTIERDEIHMETIKGWRRLPDGKWDFMLDPVNRIGYIRLTQFTRESTDEMKQALHSLKEQGAQGLVLDLRFNPGGLLDVAVDLADDFITKGLIVRTKGRNVAEEEKSATATGEFQKEKVVVLVNKLSASAAEILSGAFKDHHRGIIVGERTYGKGSVQRVIPLLKLKRSQLKLTTAYYYLPSGRCLHRINGATVWGVDPDVPVDVTLRQTNRWAEIRKETDLLKPMENDQLNSLLHQQLDDDLQLQSALLLLKVQLLGHE